MDQTFFTDFQVAHTRVTRPLSGDGRVAAGSYHAIEALYRTAGFAVAPLRTVTRRLGRYRRRRRAIAELRSLDDRMLRDIGVLRGDIPALVRSLESEPDGLAAQRAEARAKPMPAHAFKRAA
jgi:uncharacterized protein YjiS (DUF1127 family)